MNMLLSYLTEAIEEFSKGERHTSDLYDTARAIRCYTRAQVKARQVINAIHNPPESPEDMIIQNL
jgi:hypothetical protein